MKLLLLLLLAVSLFAGEKPPQFRPYWFNQGAEITSYDLKQSRYGEIHEGEAVFIYVTETWNNDKQVKAESPQSQAEGQEILKVNKIRKFATGIYDYSTMQSLFSPLDATNARTFKSTLSVQEWCGQVFTQLNFRDSLWNVRTFSHFEQENDRKFPLKPVPYEEGIWTQIRLDPSALPQGTFDMIPSALFIRFRHLELREYQAEASISPINTKFTQYRIFYPKLNREVIVHFTTRFPHTIEYWSETTQSGLGKNVQKLTTTATRKKRIFSPYWEQHSVKDLYRRKGLGLK